MGMPFLYEHLMLTKFNQTKSITAVAGQIPVLGPSLGTLGSWTRRLDIGFQDYDEGETVNAELTELLERLPQLLSLVFDSPGLSFGFPETPPVFFFKSASQSLEYFDWGPDPDVFPFNQWLNFINTHPNLRIVNGPNAEQYLNDDDEPEEKLGRATAFKHLFQLGMAGYDAGEFYCVHLPDDMPNLRGFAIEWPPFLEVEIFQSLFTRFGQNLTALYLEYEDEDEEDLELTLNHSLGSLLQLCPKLEEFFVSAWWRTDIKIDTTTGSVKVFGVKFADRQITARHCKMMLKQLTKAKKWFPNLKVVRFFEDTNLIHLRAKHSKRFQRGIAELHEAGMVVQDSEETEITIASLD
jgi:hypothetical protein